MKRVRLRHGSRKFENDEGMRRRRSIDMEGVELYIIIVLLVTDIGMLEKMRKEKRRIIIDM